MIKRLLIGRVLTPWSKDWSLMIKLLIIDDWWSRDCYFTDPQNRGDDEGWLGGCLPSRAPRWLLTIEKVTLLCFFRNFGHWYKSYFWSSFFGRKFLDCKIMTLMLATDLRLPFTRLTALSRQEGKPSQYVQVAHLVFIDFFLIYFFSGHCGGKCWSCA